MSKSLRRTATLSSVAIAALISGCASPMSGALAGRSTAASGKLGTIGAATRAQLALSSGDFATAVTWAEQAVQNSPEDATLRGLLGNAYLAAGRFASAEATYNDALTLAPNYSGVAMKLVLAQIALGKNAEAAQMLDQLRGTADPADVGLAMALAGQPGNAVALLDEAARRPTADSRTRQNLALAHALAGDWEMARAVASQDVPADQLDSRLTEWMRMAKPSSAAVQVASLLGVTPAHSDPGQPVQLALAQTQTRLASAAPAPAVVPVPQTFAETQPQLASNETVMSDPGFASAPVAAEPIVEAASSVTVPLPAAPQPEPAVQLADVSQTLDALRSEPVRASGTLPKISQLRRSAAARFARSGVVVQLGAYGSPKRVQTAWSSIARRHGSLARYTPASARFRTTSRTVYRLSLKGFSSDGEARSLCQQLKKSGSSCFVRNLAGDTPVRFASR